MTNRNESSRHEPKLHVRQSTVSMVFSRALTEKVPSSSLNERTRIISNDDGVLKDFIKMKDYIVKTTRSLRAQ